VAVAALAFATPAFAQIHGYINREAGFSFSAPGEMKTEKMTYASASNGQRQATIYKSVDDNIEFSVTVIDFKGVSTPQTDLIKEASTAFQTKGKVMADSDARVESNYGRKMTVDLPNNDGRSMAGIYFTNGYLVELQTTVLPANGDYGTPDTGRFIDSIAFGQGREEPDAVELKLQK
jgi:hypothetical protein